MRRDRVHARIGPVARLLPAVVALACACGSPGRAADAAVDAQQPVALSLVARFDPGVGARPTLFAIPFPSDVYLDPDGTVADDLADFSAIRITRGGAALAASYRDLDGFGRNAGAIFVVDGAGLDGTSRAPDVDPASFPRDRAASLAADASAFIVDLDPSLEAERARVPASAGYQHAYGAIVVQPDGVALRPAHRYALVLTTTIRSLPTGATLAPSTAFRAIRDAAPGARDAALGRMYGDAVERIVALGTDRAQIAAIAVFTAQTRHRQLRVACDAVRAGRIDATPTLDTGAGAYTVARFGSTPHDGWNATLDAWLGTPLRRAGRDVPGTPTPSIEGDGVGMAHDAIGAIFTGTFEAPEYRNADGAVVFAADGAPVAVDAHHRIPITIVLPRGPAPTGGFPAMIWGHGLGGQRRDMLSVANEIARAGVAVVAIDVVTFGSRADPTDVGSLQTGSYAGPDGFADAAATLPTAFFGNLTNLVAMRDNFRQAALDLVQVRRLLGNRALDLSFVADEYGGVAPTLDATHVAYAGDSLSGLIGTIFAAVEPSVDPFVLNVPGGGVFTNIATDAPTLGQFVNIIPPGVFGAPTGVIDRFNPTLLLVQIGLDPADPASFAADVTAPPDGARGHHVWVVESLWDEIMSNRSTELLAREMQLPQLGPPSIVVDGLAQVTAPATANLAGGATGAFLQMVPSTHGANIGSRYGVRSFEPPFPRTDGGPRYPMLAHPYSIRQPVVGYQRQVAAFLTSTFAGHATIAVDGIEPLVDMDDDGWTDDAERAAGTSPYNPTSHPAGAPPSPRDVGF